MHPFDMIYRLNIVKLTLIELLFTNFTNMLQVWSILPLIHQILYNVQCKLNHKFRASHFWNCITNVYTRNQAALFLSYYYWKYNKSRKFPCPQIQTECLDHAFKPMARVPFQEWEYHEIDLVLCLHFFTRKYFWYNNVSAPCLTANIIISDTNLTSSVRYIL